MSLGPKSRAWSIAQLLSYLKLETKPNRRKKIRSGSDLSPYNHCQLCHTGSRGYEGHTYVFLFLLGSPNENKINMSKALAINSEKNWLAFVTKG
jgi:hypothetical protein